MLRFRAEAIRPAPLRAAIGLDDVFDLPPADGAAGVGHLLEFEAAGVAQTHVSTGVDHRVHAVLVADGALVGPQRWKRRGLGEADGGIWGCSWGDIEIRFFIYFSHKKKTE